MTSFIQITRYPYEEPYHLQLEIAASNGRQKGEFEIYVATKSLAEWGVALQDFPKHRDHVYLWEVGSERAEDRWAYYVRLRAFMTDPLGHCALQIRFNNNRDLPNREIFEFCIPVEAAALNRLGALLCKFTKLEHEVLFWTPKEDMLFKTRQEAKQARSANG